MEIIEQKVISANTNETGTKITGIVLTTVAITDEAGEFHAAWKCSVTTTVAARSPRRRAKRRLLAIAANECAEFFLGAPLQNDPQNVFSPTIDIEGRSSLSLEEELSLQQELQRIERDFGFAA